MLYLLFDEVLFNVSVRTSYIDAIKIQVNMITLKEF